MSSSSSKDANVRLKGCLLEDPYDSYYRFLVDEQHVKYVKTAPETFSVERRFLRLEERSVVEDIFPQFPRGDWNSAYVAKDTKTGVISFIGTEVEEHKGVQNVWHPAQLSELDFTCQEYIKTGSVELMTHPGLNDGKPVLVKTAMWPWEIDRMELETTIYQRLDGSGISPAFLGHVMEGEKGRIIGFVLEWVEGARRAGPGDFEIAKQNCTPAELEIEMHDLMANLEDTTSD
jgi:hypothetical protein